MGRLSLSPYARYLLVAVPGSFVLLFWLDASDKDWFIFGYLFVISAGSAGAGYYTKSRREARKAAEREASPLFQRNYNDDPGNFR